MDGSRDVSRSYFDWVITCHLDQEQERKAEVKNINRTTFFAYVRKSPFGGRLSQMQIDGMNAILDAWFNTTMTDMRWLAYMLATAFHETGARMQPVRETFATSDKQAIANLDRAFKRGQLKWVKTPYWRDGAFGRGLVQITHWINYTKMGTILSIDLRGNPSLALKMVISIRIMFEGMTRGVSLKGDFTGKSLEDYFNDTVDDPEGARRIINGKDKAKLIATYHKAFLDALNAAEATYKNDGRAVDYIAPDVKPEDATADDLPATKSKSLWALIASIFAGGGLSATEALSGGSSILSAVGNPWAFLAFLSVIAGALLVWLIYTGRLQIMRKGH